MRRHFHLEHAVFCIACLLPALSGFAGPAASVQAEGPLPAGSDERRSPNIVLIYTDDLGYGDLSCYGARAITTPNIDRLARGGLRFTQAHATASTCTPSRFSLLSGHLPFRRTGTGVLRGDANLIIPRNQPTLPSVLRRAGHATACIGKWHLGLGDSSPLDWNGILAPGPNEIGFDESFIIPATNDRVPCVYVRDGRVHNLDPADPLEVSYQGKVGDEPTVREFPDAVELRTHGHPNEHHNGTIHNGVGRIGTMSGGRAARWNDATMADELLTRAMGFVTRHQDSPFFLYFSTVDIHAPRLHHPRFTGASDLGPRGDMILQLDFCVGALMARLDQLGLADRTLVIFSSDNGPMLEDAYDDGSAEAAAALGFRPAGPLRGTKYTPFEGGTRVPFIVSWPGTVVPGTSDALISQVDLLASLARLVGRALPPGFTSDSQDHLAALLGRTNRARETLITTSGKTLTIRQDNWKLIRGARPQLFNLADDLAESRDLAPERPEKTRELLRLLELEADRYRL